MSFEWGVSYPKGSEVGGREEEDRPFRKRGGTGERLSRVGRRGYWRPASVCEMTMTASGGRGQVDLKKVRELSEEQLRLMSVPSLEGLAQVSGGERSPFEVVPFDRLTLFRKEQWETVLPYLSQSYIDGFLERLPEEKFEWFMSWMPIEVKRRWWGSLASTRRQVFAEKLHEASDRKVRVLWKEVWSQNVDHLVRAFSLLSKRSNLRTALLHSLSDEKRNELLSRLPLKEWRKLFRAEKKRGRQRELLHNLGAERKEQLHQRVQRWLRGQKRFPGALALCAELERGAFLQPGEEEALRALIQEGLVESKKEVAQLISRWIRPELWRVILSLASEEQVKSLRLKGILKEGAEIQVYPLMSQEEFRSFFDSGKLPEGSLSQESLLQLACCHEVRRTLEERSFFSPG